MTDRDNFGRGAGSVLILIVIVQSGETRLRRLELIFRRSNVFKAVVGVFRPLERLFRRSKAFKAFLGVSKRFFMRSNAFKAFYTGNPF